MIRFQSFIDAIHQAIMGANDALMDKNLKLLDEYFEPIEHEGDSTYGTPDHTHEDGKGALTPKSVVMHYPAHDPDGTVKMIDVHVPLITLVPLSMSQIEEVKLETDFDIQLIDDELRLDFPKPSSPPRFSFFSGKSSAPPKTSGKLQITIKPHEGTEGLKIVVEGYEKILRSQIP